MTLPLASHGATHVGLVHDVNDDSWGVLPTDEGGAVLMVCDGMGGMGHGDEASALAVEVFEAQLRSGSGYPPERLRQAIKRADVVVREQLCNHGRGLPGSTAVLVYVVDGMAHVAWVGDSRAYLVRDGAVLERTSDHKLVNELIAAGQLTEQEAKASTLSHVVTRALGGRPPSDKVVSGSTLGHPWKLAHGDIVFLCSDGVSDLVADDELPGLLGGRSLEEATASIVRTALERGGHDNITCIVARWDGPDYVEDDIATPLMQGPRDGLPESLDDQPLIDERLGAERVTEEITLPITPPGVARRHGPPRGSEQQAREDLPVEGGRAWIVVAIAVLVLLAVVGAVLIGR